MQRKYGLYKFLRGGGGYIPRYSLELLCYAMISIFFKNIVKNFFFENRANLWASIAFTLIGIRPVNKDAVLVFLVF